MFGKLVVRVVAWQINNRYEKCALRLLEEAHVGASIEGLSDLREERGRHALVVVHH
jgi:hypothetical protein